MQAHLLSPHSTLDWRRLQRAASRFYSDRSFDDQLTPPWNAIEITADLELDTLFEAMAGDDSLVFAVARTVVLSALKGSVETIRYRQHVLQDCLDHRDVVERLYVIAGKATDKKGHYCGTLVHYPDLVVRNAIETMDSLLDFAAKLWEVADRHGDAFSAAGWITFFSMLKRDFSQQRLSLFRRHLDELRRGRGMLVSAHLGKGNKGAAYTLHSSASWSSDNDKQPRYRFDLHPRDEIGGQALRELENQALVDIARTIGRSADQLIDFFGALQAELAFYIGCANLHARLVKKGGPVCMPEPFEVTAGRLSFQGLYDVALALTLEDRVVGNDIDADGRQLVIVTGPNTGGKSTFLRSVGAAQLMMQSGMFVAARSFCGSVCQGLYTHYKREEDASMERGKFDDELSRMSAIVDHVAPGSILLLNEPFAATNELEGSEIARQLISALVDGGIKVFCVTHMYDLAHGFCEKRVGCPLFLRAGRQPNGVRTFKLAEGEPLPTSYGQELYASISAGHAKI